MKRLASAALFTLSSLFPMKLQAYPIDCAILLCLSGGWPASAPCAAARAEFIRRITPMPVEPPLQIWRCPMRAAELTSPGSWRMRPAALLQKRRLAPQGAAFDRLPLHRIAADSWADPFADLRKKTYPEKRADIDISGPEFDFVRSIRVFQTYAYQRLSGRDDDDCNRRSSVLLGTYGMQGGFRWSPARLSDLPDAHGMPEGMGTHCPAIFHRSVFVEWRDFEGRYGFEQVDY